MDLVGDLDADGWNEVIVGRNGSSPAAYVLSSLDGHVLYTFPGMGDAVAGAGDLDGDGVPDVVVGDFPSNYREPPAVVEVRSGADGSVLLHVEGSQPDDLFHRAVDWLGDVNGDGVGDIIVGVPFHGQDNTGRVVVLSGADGTLIREHLGTAWWGTIGHDVTGVGDIDGDSRADYAFTDALSALPSLMRIMQVRVVSGRTGATIHLFTTDVATYVFSPPSVDSIGDTDGDGVPDIGVGFRFYGPAQQRVVQVFSGISGAKLIEVPNVSENVAGVGDVDADGVPDIGVFGAPPDDPSADPAGLTLLSGADGTALFHLGGEHQFGSAFAGVGDLDGDGRGDVLVGAPSPLFGEIPPGCISAVSLAPPTITGATPDSVQMAYVPSTFIDITGLGFEYLHQVQVGDTVLPVALPHVTIVSPTLLKLVLPPTSVLGPVSVSVSSTGAVPSNAVDVAYVDTHPPAQLVAGLAFVGEPLTWSFFGGANDQGFLLVAPDPSTFLLQGWLVLRKFVVLLPFGLDELGTAQFSIVLPPAAQGLSVYSQIATLDGGLVGTSNIVWTLIF